MYICPIGSIGAGFIYVGSLCKEEGSSEASEKFEGTGFVCISTLEHSKLGL